MGPAQEQPQVLCGGGGGHSCQEHTIHKICHIYTITEKTQETACPVTPANDNVQSVTGKNVRHILEET